MKTLNDYVTVYKEQLEKGDIQKAYKGLLKYSYSLKTHLSKQFEDRFSFGSAGQGYLEYWNILKTTEWNKDRKTIPKYSVLEVVLTENPDFDNPDGITNDIGKKLLPLTEEIICYLKNHQQK